MRSSNALKPWAQACVRAAQNFSSLAGEQGHPLWLCLGGGLKSQAMALSFLGAEVKFTAAILEFSCGGNAIDVTLATSFCRRNEIPFELIPFDLNRFFSDGSAFFLAQKMACTQSEFLPLHWLQAELPGTSVLGLGLPQLERGYEPDYISGVSPYRMEIPWYLCHTHAEARFSNRFFALEAEQTGAFLANEIVSRLIQNKLHGKLSVKSSLMGIFSDEWNYDFAHGDLELSQQSRFQELNFFLENKLPQNNLVTKSRLGDDVA